MIGFWLLLNYVRCIPFEIITVSRGRNTKRWWQEETRQKRWKLSRKGKRDFVKPEFWRKE